MRGVEPCAGPAVVSLAFDVNNMARMLRAEIYISVDFDQNHDKVENSCFHCSRMFRRLSNRARLM